MSKPNKSFPKSVFLKNKPATFHYEIVDKLTAGIVLVGSEIKSIRLGKVSFADSYCYFRDGELWIKNLHIAEYVNAGYAGHDPTRERKLLLTKRELGRWQQKMKEKGFTVVPLSLFIQDNGFAKLNIGLGRGKKTYDKREALKERDVKKALQQGSYRR